MQPFFEAIHHILIGQCSVSYHLDVRTFNEDLRCHVHIYFEMSISVVKSGFSRFTQHASYNRDVGSCVEIQEDGGSLVAIAKG